MGDLVVGETVDEIKWVEDRTEGSNVLEENDDEGNVVKCLVENAFLVVLETNKEDNNVLDVDENQVNENQVLDIIEDVLLVE